MRSIVAFTAFLFFAACGNSDQGRQAISDTAQTPAAVIVPPSDSLNQAMPVRPADTSASDMPVLDTDTARVRPL